MRGVKGTQITVSGRRKRKVIQQRECVKEHPNIYKLLDGRDRNVVKEERHTTAGRGSLEAELLRRPTVHTGGLGAAHAGYSGVRHAVTVAPDSHDAGDRQHSRRSVSRSRQPLSEERAAANLALIVQLQQNERAWDRKVTGVAHRSLTAGAVHHPSFISAGSQEAARRGRAVGLGPPAAGGEAARRSTLTAHRSIMNLLPSSSSGRSGRVEILEMPSIERLETKRKLV